MGRRQQQQQQHHQEEQWEESDFVEEENHAIEVQANSPKRVSFPTEEESDNTASTSSSQHKNRKSSRRRSSASSSMTSQQQECDENDQVCLDMKQRKVSLAQLISCLGHSHFNHAEDSDLPQELYRRVMDYRLAQQKRLDKYGPTQKWGIYGVYLHLQNVRTDLEWAEDAAWRRLHGLPYLSWNDFDEAKQSSAHPYFVYSLMVVCTLLLIAEFAVNDWRIEPLDGNPLIGPSAETLVTMGALDTPKIVDQGQWFRLFSPLVLHAGIIHWIINMGALYFFGGAFELSHGLYSAVFLFVVPGVGGNLLSAIFLPQYISVGASGGIFGYIGACLADITVHWNLIFLKACGEGEDSQVTWKRNFWAFVWMFIEVVVNIIVGLTPYVDNFIHLGGFVYGLLCGWTVVEYAALDFLGYEATVWSKLRTFSLRFLGLMASVVFILVTTVWLATMTLGDNPCPNCRYFNCVPFPTAASPWWHCDDCSTISADLYRTETDPDDVNATSFYTRVDLTCPDQTVETVNVTADRVSEKQDMRDRLPDYCREYCDEVYSY